MGTERDFVGKQFVKDAAIELTVDLGATGLAAAGITCKLSKNGGAFASLTPTTHFTLTEIGDNQYQLKILAGVNDTAGLATVLAQNGATQTSIKSLFVEANAKTTGQLYTDLNAATLEVDLKPATIDLITSDILSEPTAGYTAVNTVGDKIRRLNNSWNDVSAASVWSYGTRTLTSISGLAADVWNTLTSTITLAGSFGKLFKDYLNAAVGTVNTNVLAVKAQTDVFNFDGSDNVLSAPQTQLTISAANLAAIADAVLDEAITGHTTADTVGKALQYARGSAIGKWKVTNVLANSFQIELYDVNNTTLLGTFTVTTDANGKPTLKTT